MDSQSLGELCKRGFTKPTHVSVIFASNTKYGTNTCEDEVTVSWNFFPGIFVV